MTLRATPLRYEDQLLRTLELPAGTLRITAGVGSGLTRRASDPPATFWAVGDRGPNMKPEVAARRFGLIELGEDASEDAKVMPCPDIGPALSEFRIEGDAVRMVRTIPLTDRSGRALPGLPPPGTDAGRTEPALAIDGQRLAPDPGGVDSEGIAAAADGSFRIGDEYGPSILHADASGRVLARWVPAGTEAGFAGADYPVLPALPAIAARRRLNRGFEALALSEDEAWLYLAFQSPLAHPDEHAHKHGRHVRIWKLDAATGAVAAQYLYPLDWSDLKVSELVVAGPDRLIVLERASATTKLYAVDLDAASAVAPEHLEVATRPTLEELSAARGLAGRVPVLAKTPILSTDDLPDVDADLEGMILLAPDSLLLVNDNDFGVEDVPTRFWRIDLPEPLA